MEGKIKILIVDDSENECKSLKSILDAKGYQVFTAHNASEAIASARVEPPRLILLDLFLKEGSNGVEAFKDIKKIALGVKAILITGHSVEETSRLLDEVWVEEGIVDEVLTKPLRVEKLIEVIEKYTKGNLNG